MTLPKPIFGLRFHSNVEIHPSQEELDAFLAGSTVPGGRERRGSDLERYQKLLDDVAAFRQAQPQDPVRLDLRSNMYYSVLSRSQLFNQPLKSAIEQYKYLLNDIQTIDLRKPASFIRSAEEEIGRLNPKKKDQAVRRERLLIMVSERKELLARSMRRKTAAEDELLKIAVYVRENLARIMDLCRTSITVLRDFRSGGETEHQLIEDIKTHFKEQIRDSLHQGPVTKQYIGALQKEVALLSQEISALISHDVHALIGLYQSVHDHAETIARGLAAALKAQESRQDGSAADAASPFARIARLLSSLVSEYRFELTIAEPGALTVYPSILLEKRREALDRLFAQLTRERRTPRDRRADRDRRQRTAANRTGPERRTGKDRRSGRDRRKDLEQD
jgi:hypothetical protein